MDDGRYPPTATTSNAASKNANQAMDAKQIKNAEQTSLNNTQQQTHLKTNYDPARSYQLQHKFYDYIIIGSGAGGAVTAYYLTEAGANVLLIESGKHFKAADYPRNELGANGKLLWGGGTELTTDAKTIILRGRVLGGGTVVNQALLDRFDDIAFDDFKADSGVSHWSSQNMAAHYDEVESHLAMHTFTREDRNRNAQLYVDAYDKLGYKWAYLRRGQSCCNKDNDCIMCLGGCQRDSKQSMGITFLKKADPQRLTIVTECHVDEVLHGKDFVTIVATQQGQPVRFYGNKAILSAGAIGSTHLLLKMQLPHKLPALGKNFFCHPQIMNIGLMDEVVDAHKGMFQSVKSVDPRFRKAGYKFENVFAGPVAIAMLQFSYGKTHQEFMSQYRNMSCMEIALRDETPGTLSLNKNRELVVDKPLNANDKAKLLEAMGIVQDMMRTIGAKKVMQSPLQIGLHLQGGCAMGHDLKQAVVGEDFKVYGCDNLYVIDGGLFPNAPGINPSLSIMATSHLGSQTILKEAGASITSNLNNKSKVNNKDSATKKSGVNSQNEPINIPA